MIQLPSSGHHFREQQPLICENVVENWCHHFESAKASPGSTLRESAIDIVRAAMICHCLKQFGALSSRLDFDISLSNLVCLCYVLFQQLSWTFPPRYWWSKYCIGLSRNEHRFGHRDVQIRRGDALTIKNMGDIATFDRSCARRACAGQ